LHLEGPFLNPAKSGAQDARFIQKPNFDWIVPYLDHIRVITIAPEMPGAESFIREIAVSHPQIILSIGHSEADYDTALESFGWGISHVTHLFNAMPPWHHRAPGIIGALFDSDITADIIADLIHTHPNALRTVQAIKKEKLILITDAMRAGCMKSGIYDLGGQKVTVSEGRATLDNGVLAGSVLKLNEAVKNYYTLTDATLSEALFSVTELPAQRLGLSSGVLKEGFDADIVIFDDEIQIKSVYIDGEYKL
jgi:N-acetylglucosamine-6-phosphate deacetylase